MVPPGTASAGKTMQRLIGLLAGVLLSLCVMQASAGATTITLDATPSGDTAYTGAGHVGTFSFSLHPLGFHFESAAFEDVVTLNLNSTTGFANLDLTTLLNVNITGLTYTLYNSLSQSLGSLSTYTQLGVGTYFLKISGATTLGLYVTKLEAQAVTPIPPALLLFMTALGGLGFASYRRRNLAA